MQQYFHRYCSVHIAQTHEFWLSKVFTSSILEGKKKQKTLWQYLYNYDHLITAKAVYRAQKKDVTSGLMRKVALIRKTVTTTPATINITLILSGLVWTATITESQAFVFQHTLMRLRPTNTRAHKRTYTYKQLQTYVHIFAHKKNANSFYTFLHTFTRDYGDWYSIQSVLLCSNTNAAML